MVITAVGATEQNLAREIGSAFSYKMTVSSWKRRSPKEIINIFIEIVKSNIFLV